MSILTLTISNNSYEMLSFESIELFLIKENPSQFNSNLFLSACMFSSFLILINNGYLLKQLKKTFLDWMIVFDCSLCICNIFTIIGEYEEKKEITLNWFMQRHFVGEILLSNLVVYILVLFLIPVIL